MVGNSGDAVAGVFEELPALLVVLVGISLFMVSAAHSFSEWGGDQDYASLQEDCQTFTAMVKSSDLLCSEGKSGCFDMAMLENCSEQEFLSTFNSSVLEFEYQVTIQCLNISTGLSTFTLSVNSSDMRDALEIATFSTCVSVYNKNKMEAARLSVSIWRASV